MAVSAQQELPGDEIGPADGDPLLREVEPLELGELVKPSTFLDLLGEAFRDVAGDLLGRLPWLLVGLAALLVVLVIGRLVAGALNAGLRRASVDFAVRRLVVNLLRIAALSLAVLIALSIFGIDIRGALAAIGLVGLALAFALQNILENQISGILILTRKPFVRGDLIVTNDYEGYVEDIDLRVTTLREHDGKTTLVPNADVLTSSMTNFTRRGIRRTTVDVGIDYRDHHDQATRVLHAALIGVEGVLDDPAHEVLLVGFGDSSIDLEVRFWTDADNKTVRQTRHRVISACKHALDEAGMTIPWPIRTLAADREPLQVRPDAEPSANGRIPDRSGNVEEAGERT